MPDPNPPEFVQFPETVIVPEAAVMVPELEIVTVPGTFNPVSFTLIVTAPGIVHSWAFAAPEHSITKTRSILMFLIMVIVCSPLIECHEKTNP